MFIDSKKMFAFDDILSRVKMILDTESDKDVASAIGMRPNTFHMRKKNNSIPLIEFVTLADSKKVNMDWLIYGSGPIYKDADPKPEKQTQSATDNVQPDCGHRQGKITDLITKTIEILESNTVYSGALSANIDAFHEAARTEKKLIDLQVSMESRFKLMDQRMALLEEENKKLKDMLDDSPDNGGNLASGQN